MSKKFNDTERVRGKYNGMKKLIVGATAKPIAETRVLPPTHRHNPPPLVVEIDADLHHAFPDAASVNQALRAFRELVETK